MKYKNVVQGEFISRPNRFIAKVRINGKEETVHVKNTGRCKEILIPGAEVHLSVSDNPERKTKYDLIAVKKETDRGTLLINIDSQIPNWAAEEFLPRSGLFSDSAVIRREVKYGNSRFDLYVEDGQTKAFIEVKGVTLEKGGTALFPDAPTERGVKHIKELISAKEKGFDAYILFVIQMAGVHTFSPNTAMHPEFAEALITAQKAGVKIQAYDCDVTENSIILSSPVTVKL